MDSRIANSHHSAAAETHPRVKRHSDWLSGPVTAGPDLYLDAELRLLSAPLQALAHLRGWLWADNGRLRVAPLQAQRQLEQWVRAACDNRRPAAAPRPRALALARGARAPLVLTVYAGIDLCADGPPYAVLTLRDPEHVIVDPGLLCDLFELTAAEAVVVAAIAQGLAAEQIAQAQGIKLGTVNAHLKKALAKTGTSRQAVLVALVLRCAARLPGQPAADPPRMKGAVAPNLDHLGNARLRAA
jgi:DNA-binding CsgD family transcriptional regulator